MDNEPPATSQPRTPLLGGIVKTLGPATWLAVASAFLPAFGSVVLLARMNTIGQWIRSHEFAGMTGFTLGYAALTGIAVIPTQITAILGGWAFGFETGSICVLIGLAGSSMVAYTIARYGAGSRVDTLFQQHPRWAAVRNALIGGGFFKSLAIILLIRLPSTPYSIVNLVLGSTRAHPLAFLIGTVVGMAPRMLLFVYFAADVSKRLDPEKATEVPLPKWMFAASVAAAIVAFVIIGSVAKRALSRITATQP